MSPPTIKPASVIQNIKYNETNFTVLIKSVANTNTYYRTFLFIESEPQCNLYTRGWSRLKSDHVDRIIGVEHHFQQYFSYAMVASYIVDGKPKYTTVRDIGW